MREEIAEAVVQALAASQPPPSNEQETCFRIIDPLLRAMGYGLQEISIQPRDNANQKPDYCILAGSPNHTWFLEAKAWSVNLDVNHAIQAVNYANTQGKRWVVVSNGRQWRLYDNKIFGPVDVKLACVSEISDGSFVSFLEAISKASVQKGKLEDYVRNERLYSCLSAQITQPDSDVIKAVVRTLRGIAGLSNVTAADVIGFLKDYASAPAPAPMPTPVFQPAAISPAVPGVEAVDAAGAEAGHPLGSLTPASITGKKIRALVTPNGTRVPTTVWHRMTIAVAAFALENGNLPAPPIFIGNKSKSPLLAKSGTQGTEKMREPNVLPAPFNEWQVEGHYSAFDHQKASVRILSLAGIDPATFRVIIGAAQGSSG